MYAKKHQQSLTTQQSPDSVVYGQNYQNYPYLNYPVNYGIYQQPFSSVSYQQSLSAGTAKLPPLMAMDPYFLQQQQQMQQLQQQQMLMMIGNSYTQSNIKDQGGYGSKGRKLLQQLPQLSPQSQLPLPLMMPPLTQGIYPANMSGVDESRMAARSILSNHTTDTALSQSLQKGYTVTGFKAIKLGDMNTRLGRLPLDRESETWIRANDKRTRERDFSERVRLQLFTNN